MTLRIMDVNLVVVVVVVFFFIVVAIHIIGLSRSIEPALETVIMLDVYWCDGSA